MSFWVQRQCADPNCFHGHTVMRHDIFVAETREKDGRIEFLVYEVGGLWRWEPASLYEPPRKWKE